MVVGVFGSDNYQVGFFFLYYFFEIGVGWVVYLYFFQGKFQFVWVDVVKFYKFKDVGIFFYQLLFLEGDVVDVGVYEGNFEFFIFQNRVLKGVVCYGGICGKVVEYGQKMFLVDFGWYNLNWFSCF